MAVIPKSPQQIASDAWMAGPQNAPLNTATGPTGAGVGGSGLGNTPAENAALADLQSRSLTGLTGLMNRDSSAMRKKMEDALYAGSSEAIDRAADLQRRASVEGTFGRGVGSSSITTELLGRLAQEHNDSLARARNEAFTQAGAEDRADLASQLAQFNSGFQNATTGRQANANIVLTDLARAQQADQFARNLAFQGSEGAANRAQQSSLLNRQLSFTGSENAANRSFTGGENAANRALQKYLQESGQTFTSGQNDLTRELARWQQTNAQDYNAGQSALNRDWQGTQAGLNRDFTGTQAQLNRDWQGNQLTQQQTWQAGQNDAARAQQMALYMTNLAQQNSQFADAMTAAGITGGIKGIAALGAPFLEKWLKDLGS